MSTFRWQKQNGTLQLVHIDAASVEHVVNFDDVNTYVSNLHASERQSPIPPFPLDDAAIEAVNDPAVKAAADSRPDALRAAVAQALAKAEACMLAADNAAETADKASAGAYKALQELRDIAAELAKPAPPPAPIAEPAKSV